MSVLGPIILYKTVSAATLSDMQVVQADDAVAAFDWFVVCLHVCTLVS